MRCSARWILPLGLALACAGPAELAPDPELSPEDVVRFQIEALAADEDADGIERSFRFASPANREVTGPLERFITIVRAPDYRPLLNHVEADYGVAYVEGDRASQTVTITARDGSRHVYAFQLSRQRGGGFDACWMTDAVLHVETLEPAGLGI